MRLKKSSYLALEDAIFDSRIPLRSEEEFRVGITFIAKLVGCGNVPRPNSRIEIVASMRRIRSDCRLRKDKKRKTILTVSYEGVKVALFSRKKSNSNLIITQHPINRIFYVSHDSLDLHVFSYIAREGNVFKCFVFKAAKQSLAVNIVRTIGQAFELCHKMTFIINECTNGSTAANSTTETGSNHTLIETESNNNNNNINCSIKDQSDKRTSMQNLHKDLSLNMEQMIHDVDCKLDKLSDKIELLERQISVMLSSMNIQKRSNNNNKLSQSESSKKNVINQEDITNCSMEESDKKMLNSPDSLLSSPNQEIFTAKMFNEI